MKKNVDNGLTTGFFLLCLTGAASATLYGGVDFPDGAVSFADEVVSYSPAGSVVDIFKRG